jgi:nitroimidazol reductase NimA-like FMN-containing flavoprotein (pyridoxamine 5'-phosphate oxidase superfamily)
VDATSPRLAELGRTQCLDLIRSAELGRIGVSVDALPAIFPVFLTLVDDFLVFRSIAGTKMSAAAAGAIVAVELDEFDPATGQGWSVLVRGVAHAISDGERADLARERLRASWVGDGDGLVEVSVDLVTGRRIG